ncbi:MAG TPA: alkaline phosphatase family protein [Candidatus Binatia bacterium]|nr:alkaline phosphatase family protein [Candidatus Binatia bacterium]
MKRFGLFVLCATLAGAAGCNNSSSISPPPTMQPAHSIQHVVILLQENRSFNNIFMGFPGATTATTGLCKPAKWCPPSGKVPITTVALESTNQFALGTDISHSHGAFVVECDPNASNVCQNDGFDKITFGQALYGPPAKLYPYRAVKRSETKAYWDFASQYGLADDMFFTATASSFIAHQQIIAGTTRLNANESLTDQPDATPWGCDAPPSTVTAIIKTNGQVNEFGGPFPCFTQYKTMADLLDAASTSWKFYVSSINGDFSGGVWNGFDAIRKVRYGPDWKDHMSFPNTNVFKDVQNGTLPAVSWVIPKLADSDHPASGCNHGPHWITSVVNAIGTSKYWNSTAILVAWDDWGGWYDSVPAPQTNYTSLGFRVPLIVISPYVKPHTVGHTQYDFGSILKFIEQTFGLGSLGTSDVRANSLSDMFDLSQPPNAFHKEPLPPTKNCGSGSGGSPSMEQIIEHDNGVPE